MISDRIMTLTWWLSVLMTLVISCLTNTETVYLQRFFNFKNENPPEVPKKDPKDEVVHDFEQFANDMFNEFKKRLPQTKRGKMDPIIRQLLLPALLPAFLHAREMKAQENYHGWGG